MADTGDLKSPANWTQGVNQESTSGNPPSVLAQPLAQENPKPADSDHDLARLIAAWPTLPAATREAIVALAVADGKTEG
jgi:hypothetical protein